MELGLKVKGYSALRACSWFILDSADVLKEVNGCMYGEILGLLGW